MSAQFLLPIYFDLSAIFLLALTGAWVAIRRHHDFVGVFILALVTGVGGALMRDGMLLQEVPAVLRDPRYLYAVLGAALLGGLTYRLARRFERLIAAVDALGLGAYAVVGMQKSFALGLSPMSAMVVGVVNAVGGGILRDIIVREEPLIFKPGQLYALAALAGCLMFAALNRLTDLHVQQAAYVAIGTVFLLRMLAIQFNWTTQVWHQPDEGAEQVRKGQE
ncbi:MAG: TRIC cation channel family protein [Burkholderiales bacterium]|nr:TRIC cation channel family protein [Burkholderiales bacterium]